MEAFKKENINIKNSLLVIMAVVIIGFIIFRPSNEIDDGEKQIELLKIQNRKYEAQNDSLMNVNIDLELAMRELYGIIEIRNTELSDVKNNIKVLEGKRNEVRNRVNTMDGGDVSSTYTDYLKRRGKNNN